MVRDGEVHHMPAAELLELTAALELLREIQGTIHAIPCLTLQDVGLCPHSLQERMISQAAGVLHGNDEIACLACVVDLHAQRLCRAMETLLEAIGFLRTVPAGSSGREYGFSEERKDV